MTGENGTAVLVGTGDIPDIGSPVFDSDRNRVGIVKRVFGPIGEPFVTITVDNAALMNRIKGMKLYTIRRPQNGKDKRRNRRD